MFNVYYGNCIICAREEKRIILESCCRTFNQMFDCSVVVSGCIVFRVFYIRLWYIRDIAQL